MLRADPKFAPRQWETALHGNDVSDWLGASLESALMLYANFMSYTSCNWNLCIYYKQLFFRLFEPENIMHRKVSNISRTLVGKKIVDHSDVVGASPVGAAPTTSSFST